MADGLPEGELPPGIPYSPFAYRPVEQLCPHLAELLKIIRRNTAPGSADREAAVAAARTVQAGIHQLRVNERHWRSWAQARYARCPACGGLHEIEERTPAGRAGDPGMSQDSVTIRVGFPPNIDQIRAVFPRLPPGVIFAWEGTIYSPGGPTVSPALQEHEKTHFKQQRATGGAAAWWERYLRDPAWRLEQEMEAHIAEYRFYAARHGRKERRAYLDEISKRMASPTYGGMITARVAKDRIKRAVQT